MVPEDLVAQSPDSGERIRGSELLRAKRDGSACCRVVRTVEKNAGRKVWTGGSVPALLGSLGLASLIEPTPVQKSWREQVQADDGHDLLGPDRDMQESTKV